MLILVKTHEDGSKTYKECFSENEVLESLRKEEEEGAKLRLIDDNGRTVGLDHASGHFHR